MKTRDAHGENRYRARAERSESRTFGGRSAGARDASAAESDEGGPFGRAEQPPRTRALQRHRQKSAVHLKVLGVREEGRLRAFEV